MHLVKLLIVLSDIFHIFTKRVILLTKLNIILYIDINNFINQFYFFCVHKKIIIN